MKKLIPSRTYEFSSKYYADDNGHIWSESKQDYLNEYEDKNGYKKVVLMTKDRPAGKGHRFSVHRLILSTFNPVNTMDQLTVDHIDGDITNNSLSNLRWTTIQENLENENTKFCRRCYDQDGTHNAVAKFNISSLIMIVEDINSGMFTRKEICTKYDVSLDTLNNIINKTHYKEELAPLVIMPNFISDYKRDTVGEKNGRAKLTEQSVLEIITLLKTNKYSYKEIGNIYGVSDITIWHIKNKDTWKYLTKHITFD